MADYASLRKRNNGTFTAAAALALCVLLSTSMLLSRLTVFTQADTCHYIPLTKSSGLTQVTSTGGSAYHPASHALLAASPAKWFRVTDDQQVWRGKTEIEIFRLSYENGAGQITVESSGGDKVIAPGTENTYSFALENTGYEPVKYEMSMETYFTDGIHVIPVEARVFDHEGNYLAGSAEAYADVLELSQVQDSGTLRVGYVQPYTLQWQWPFEGDNSLDTYLGNLAVEEDITLTIVIHTYAEYTPTDDGGIPKTGDTTNLQLLTGIMVASGAGLILILLFGRPKREERDD